MKAAFLLGVLSIASLVVALVDKNVNQNLLAWTSIILMVLAILVAAYEPRDK